MRVIGSRGEQLGVLPIAEAIAEAKAKNLDLVEVSPVANPPVCKIVDFGQLQYEQKKKDRLQRSKQKKTETKGLRVSTTISDHDLEVRVNQATKFLTKGNKVQVELLLRGRQKAHPEIGQEVVQRFIDALEDVATVESPIERKGSKFIALLSAKKQ